MNRDRIYELYEGSIGPDESQARARRRIHWLCRHVEGTDVLDVGCSQGIASILLAREGKHVVGIDNETAAIEYAVSRLQEEEGAATRDQVRFEVADARALPYEDDSFDTVLLGEVIEHQVDPRPLVVEARRVLRPKGVIVVTAPYGIFRYPDHKEPIYLSTALALFGPGFAVEEVEFIERWLGIVARSSRSRQPLGPAIAVKALAVAEERLADVDKTLEERREALKGIQRQLTEARAANEEETSRLRELEFDLRTVRTEHEIRVAEYERAAERRADEVAALRDELTTRGAELEAERRRASDLALRAAEQEVHLSEGARRIAELSVAAAEQREAREALEQGLEQTRSAHDAAHDEARAAHEAALNDAHAAHEAALNATRSSLETELRETRTSLEEQLEGARTTIAEIEASRRDQQAAHGKERWDTSRELALRADQIDGLREAVAAREMELDTARRSLAEQAQELSEVRAAEQRAEAARREHQAVAHAERSHTSRELARQADEVAALRDELTTRGAELEAERRRASDLALHAAEQEVHLSEGARRIAELSVAAAEQREARTALEEQLGGAREMLAEREAHLGRELAELRAALSGRGAEVIDLGQKLAAAGEELGATGQELALAREELGATGETLRQLRETVATRDAELDQQRQQVIEHEMVATVNQARIEDLEAARARAEDRLATEARILSDEIDRLTEMARGERVRSREFEQRVNELEAKVLLARRVAAVREPALAGGLPPGGVLPSAPADSDAVPEEGDEPINWTERGQDLFNAGDDEGALAAFQRAVQQADEALPWLAMGQTLRRMKRLPEALSAMKRACELQPGWPNAVWSALQVTSRLDRTEEFEDLVAAELGSISQLAVKDLGRLGPFALRAGAYGIARDAGRRLLEQDPDSEDGLALMASALWELEDEAGADAVVNDGLDRGAQTAVRAALRFDLHVDRFERVETLLGRLSPPDDELTTSFVDQLTRRGEAQRAIDLARGVTDQAAYAAKLEPLLARAEAWVAAVDRRWAQRPALSIEPILGRPLHLVERSLPHHTSGGTYRTHYIVTAQRRAGIDPQLVTQLGFPWSSGIEPSSACEILDGVPYYRLTDPNLSDERLDAWLGRSLDALLPLVEQLRPAVLHPASDYHNALLALALRERTGLPVVYEVRGFPEVRLVRRAGSRGLQDRSVGRRDLERRCMLEADRIVTLAEVMKSYLVDLGVDSDKITVVPNAVDPSALHPVARDEGLARSLGVDGVPVIGYVSTFHGYEGIRYIVEATAELKRRGRDVRALLVGDGHERGALEQLAQDLGVSDRVILTGRVPHDIVRDYYGLIDLFVVPRRAEATSELVTPLKPFEAMAMQLTVLVSDVGALREMVKDGETGRTFRPEDPVHLADVVEELLDDPAQKERLAQTAREWVIAERTWDQNAQRYRRLYEELGAL